MKISVIIPFHNNYVSILKTLDSLEVQSKDLHEVIIIDDCSDDELRVKKTIDTYRSTLPILLKRNEQNKNGAYSRNIGIQSATGNIIAFLDADDTWEPNKSSRILEVYKTHGDNTLYFSKAKIKQNNNVIGSRPKHFNDKIHISEYLFLEDGFIQTSSIFCSSAVAKKILFQEKFNRHQDYDFVLRAYKEGINFKYIPEELVTYNSVIKPNTLKGESYEYSLFWLNEMKPYFSKKGVQGFKIFNLTVRLLNEKRYRKAVSNLLAALLGLNLFSYPVLRYKAYRLISDSLNRKLSTKTT